MATETALRTDLVPYEEAARLLGLQVSTIKQLVYRDTLHPFTVPGSVHKYLARNEIEWYDRRRSRTGPLDEPNPVVVAQQAEQYAATANLLDAVSGKADGSTPVDLPADFGILGVLLIVVLLLLALLSKREPDPQRLNELKTAPQLQEVRRAIMKLASEIAA